MAYRGQPQRQSAFFTDRVTYLVPGASRMTMALGERSAHTYTVARPLRAYGLMIDDGFAIAFYCDHRGRRIGRVGRQAGEADGKTVLRKIHRLPRAEDPSGLNLCLKAADGNYGRWLIEAEPLLGRGISGPEVDMNIQGVATPRIIRKDPSAELAALGVVDGAAVSIHPSAYGFEDLDRLLRHRAVRFRADI